MLDNQKQLDSLELEILEFVHQKTTEYCDLTNQKLDCNDCPVKVLCNLDLDDNIFFRIPLLRRRLARMEEGEC